MEETGKNFWEQCDEALSDIRQLAQGMHKAALTMERTANQMFDNAAWLRELNETIKEANAALQRANMNLVHTELTLRTGPEAKN